MQLITNRLILRPINDEDLDELFALQSDPNVMKYIGHGVRSIEEVKTTLALCIAHQKQFGHGLYAVLNKENQEFIGRAGIIRLGLDANAEEVEIAFAFKTAYWNKGYGYEVASQLLDHWFQDPKHQRVVAVARMENTACIKLLNKIGLKFERLDKYKDISDVGYFAIEKETSP